MLKIIGCILILGASTFGGFFYSEAFKHRLKQLNEVERSIYQLQNEIIYTHTPIPEALENVSIKGIKPISQIFYEISQELSSNKHDSVQEAFKYIFDKRRKSINLKNCDIDVILDLSKCLGESDINGQVSMFSLTDENIKKLIIEAEINMKKNVKMYRSLGFCIGAVVILMLI